MFLLGFMAMFCRFSLKQGSFLFFSFIIRLSVTCSSGAVRAFSHRIRIQKTGSQKGRGGMRCIQNEDARSASDRLRMDDSDSGTGTDGLWRWDRDGDADPALEYRGYCYTEDRGNSIPFPLH